MTRVSIVLKIIELVCDIIAVILCGAGPSLNEGNGRRALCQKRHWYIIEIAWCIFIALFYFISSIVIATAAKDSGVYGAAAFFGFAAFCTYVADAIYQFLELRSTPRAEQYATNTSPGNA
ncbi:unnamed protein product [Rotaria sordida]|uniref:MARVEL domain-containing protein n=1 Tax=Rotaria sordida TaxID=392033 RepID=A0A814F3E4_9BILA|nr:unnamed protein product [Rotaria sordida]CAF1161731.1 unnamed protein product [Rotaria sordida]CAF3569858.1 unnamed protein product [Rotaria sordida]CAF3627639.1 unnamed protein product [Rotaria sordida]